ncbi:MAG: peptidylprolyl isomerase [Rubripirellula sp.]|jgi:cyclophilin family peptidyl-prolyl cis-trans isomerase|nr:peptidyl-prolyl cis-trans isomerase [Planctomycetaceae bacterium]MDF1842276.1 peptidylprolyl isomerase [Rubripirellula sp.]
MQKRVFGTHLLTIAVVAILAPQSILAPNSAIGQESEKGKNPQVELETTMGNFVIELNQEKAPKTVANFLQYVKDGHYKDTVFHRVIADFMIQGGGMDADLKEKETRPPVVNEAGNGLSNKKYTVAMARTSDPNSATSQFFVNVADNGYLDRNNAQNQAGYTVFGKVVKGMDVVDQIGKVETRTVAARGLMRDVPAKTITIKEARLLKN